MKRVNISVSQKILLLFLAITIITIGFSYFIGSPLIEETGQKASIRSTGLGEKAVQDSSAALEESAERELSSLARDKAEITNLYFTRAEGMMRFLAGVAAQHVYENGTVPGAVYTKEIRPPDPAKAALIHLAPNASTSITGDEATFMSGMDKFCIPLLGVNSDLDSIYIGSSSGIIRVYPWTDTLPDTYDPRLRPWFTLAQQNGNLSWTNPYVDSSSKTLMMTCAIPVRTEGKNFDWVIGLDVKVQTINEIINSTDTGGEGYAFLIDQNGDIIVRPGLSSEDVRWDESYSSENLLKSDNADLRSVAEDMIAGKTGVRRVSFAEGERIIAYAPISSTQWSIGIVRPVSSVLAPVNQTEQLIRNEIDAAAHDIKDDKQDMLNTYLLGSLVLLIAVSILAILFARFITRPVKVLMEATRVIGTGDLSRQVTLHTGDEFEELGDLFNRMSQSLVQVMANLERTTAEKERYATELDIAKEIQQSFLPESIPVVTGLDIAARSLMAREVGGDFFDIFPFEVVRINTSRLILMIADVSGKGVPAALFMALARIVIRVNASWYDIPADVINAANTIISRESRSGMFVTTFYADYTEETNRLRYVNAGHNPPILLRNGEFSVMSGTGPAIGIMPDMQYSSGYVDLKSGDLLAFYTDGVTEAVNNNLELLGEQRLNDLLSRYASQSAQQILDEVFNAVEVFAEGRSQEDDITLIIIKVK